MHFNNVLLQKHNFFNISFFYHQTESQKASDFEIFKQHCILVLTSALPCLDVQSSMMFVDRQDHEPFVCVRGDPMAKSKAVI